MGGDLGYAVLLLEHGVLCVLPILWAALLFSEAGWDFWVGWVGVGVPPADGVETQESMTKGNSARDWNIYDPLDSGHTG